MIKHVIGVPYLSYVDMYWITCESIKAPLMHLSSIYPEGFKLTKPEVILAFLNIRFVYAASVQDFMAFQDRFIEDDRPVAILVHDAVTVLNEHKIPLHPKTSITAVDLLMMDTETLGDMPFERVKRYYYTRHALMERFNAPKSILQRIHPLFYRVRNKAEREQVQKSVLRYLSDSTLSFPGNLPGAIEKVLSNPEVQSLRLMMDEVRRIGLDEVLAKYPNVDEYELRYLRSKQ